MLHNSLLSRRQFLQRSSVFAVPWIVPSRVLAAPGRPGANDRIQIGVIGTGIRGKYLIGNVPAAARIAAICDCHAGRMAGVLKPKATSIYAKVLAQFLRHDVAQCRTYQDYRRLVDRATLDAVIIATSDHHHAMAAILACQAGLDVYVEKPLAVTIGEGRAIVNAARHYKRVVQVGSQQRTMEINRFACEFIRNGGLGKVSLVQLRPKPGPLRYDQFVGPQATRKSSDFRIDLSEEPVPDGLAWDLFCGPTPLRPHNRKLWQKEEFRVHNLLWRGWDLWRSYSGHLMTNWGAHSVDMVQYALGMDENGPVAIWPERDLLAPSLDEPWLTKTPPFGAAGDQPSDEMRFCPVSMRYSDGTEVRFDPKRRFETAFHGERGMLYMARNRFRTEPIDLVTDAPDFEEARKKWQGLGIVARPHIENWLECMRTRSLPNAPIETGHRSATVCHLANIARELGRKLHWDPNEESFVGDADANTRLTRPRRPGWQLPKIG